MAATNPPAQTFVRRLGRHHFAHLRAVAEGVSPLASARRYLGIEHGHEGASAHRQAVDAVRAVARRHNEAAWRLIGLAITVPLDATRPSLEEFIDQRALDGWRECEVAQMYAEAYPPDARAARRQRLRDRQRALLRRLEALAAETPAPDDLVSGWFDDVTAGKLAAAGMPTLGDLNRRIAAGGQWFSRLAAIGQGKARRIAAHLATLLPQEPPPARPLFVLLAGPSLLAAPTVPAAPTVLAAPLQAPRPAPGHPDGRLLEAAGDQAAVSAWIEARAGSQHTRRAYAREAHRLLLWLQHERSGKTLASLGVHDCRDYMAFLQDIPQRWISRQRAAPGQPGWAPFKGPLSHGSQQQAILIVAGLFAFLVAARHISANPWILVNTDTGDDRLERMLDSKAFSEAAYAQILGFVEAQTPGPSRARIRFILRFVEAVGLRSAELLSATLGDLRLEPEGWMLQVAGKGSRNRVVAVPPQAFDALQDYLLARGLGTVEQAPTQAPLLASTLDPLAPIGYQALYETVRGWIRRALSACPLTARERLDLARASTHWLRHTFGTRAIARGVPLDVIQLQMGHASIQTTVSTYGRAPMKRRADELKKAFG